MVSSSKIHNDITTCKNNYCNNYLIHNSAESHLEAPMAKLRFGFHQSNFQQQVKSCPETTDAEINYWCVWHNLSISIFGSHGTFKLDIDGKPWSLYKFFYSKTSKDTITASELWTKQKTPIQFSEAELIFSAMFRNLSMIDGSQKAVWRLALGGEIPQNYENHSYWYLLYIRCWGPVMQHRDQTGYECWENE